MHDAYVESFPSSISEILCGRVNFPAPDGVGHRLRTLLDQRDEFNR
jgi:hypothetical protein